MTKTTKSTKSVDHKDPKPSPPHSINVNVDLNLMPAGTTESRNTEGGSSWSATTGSAASGCSCEFDMKPSNVSDLRNNVLLSILAELRFMTDTMKTDNEAGDETNEWKFVARVIDRLCLWLFTVYLVIGTLVIYSN